MAISTFDGFIAAAKQQATLMKTASRTAVATAWFSLFDLAGNPGAGVLAGTSTTAGVVPDDTTVGCPLLTDFGASNTGYLAQVEFSSTVAGRLALFDMLFKAGAYGFAAGTTTLSAQPSYAARIPSSDYSSTQIWIEVSTAFATGTAWQVQVTYTNQSGTTGRSTVILPASAAAALTQGRMYQLALQAGDSGVQKIESVIVTNGGTAMTAGAFNVLVLRRLWSGRARLANDGGVADMAATGLPQLFQNSALVMLAAPDSTATGVPEVQMVIANG